MAKDGLQIAVLVLSASGLFLAPSLASAQAQEYTACYVEEVGAMYFIDLPGLPTECLSPAHRRVQWGEGGERPIAAGSVNTAALADLSVSNQKLASSSVSSDKLRPRAVTGTHLSLNRQTVVEQVEIAPGIRAVGVDCPSGLEVLGGGFELQNTSVPVEVIHSYPKGADRWVVTFRNNGGSVFVRTWAVCADLGLP